MGRIRSLSPMSIGRWERLVVSNEVRGSGTRHGAALDGNPGNGKTTIVSHFGRHYERRCRQRHPEELTADGHEYLPVVYVDVDALPTMKGLNHAILTATGWGRHSVQRPRVDAAGTRMRQVLSTSLVVIDDIHLMELRREADRDANNHLKRLANDLQAMFV